MTNQSKYIPMLIGLYFPNYLYKNLISVQSGSRKTDLVLNLIKVKELILKQIYFFVKDPFESKYQLEKVQFTKKRKFRL